MTICIANEKGGSGKSTLCLNRVAVVKARFV